MALKMTQEKKRQAYEMLENGMSYEDTAEQLGVCRMTLYHHIPGRRIGRMARAQVYPNLIEWGIRSEVDVRMLGEMLYLSYSAIHNRLTGCVRWKKEELEKLVEITGLSREEILERKEERAGKQAV